MTVTRRLLCQSLRMHHIPSETLVTIKSEPKWGAHCCSPSPPFHAWMSCVERAIWLFKGMACGTIAMQPTLGLPCPNPAPHSLPRPSLRPPRWLPQRPLPYTPPAAAALSTAVLAMRPCPPDPTAILHSAHSPPPRPPPSASTHATPTARCQAHPHTLLSRPVFSACRLQGG